MLNKTGTAVVAGDNSVLGQAGVLVSRLRKDHGPLLDKLNIPISVRLREEGSVSVVVPLQVGATGVEIICEFKPSTGAFDQRVKSNKGLKPSRVPMFIIYAHAARDGDPLKGPFGNFVKDHFPEFSWTERGRRWGFVTLVPPKELTTSFLGENDETCFPRFAGHVDALSQKVMPNLLDWAVYASEISDAIENIEERLKKVFPENDGWRVGAPEGGRLNGFLASGKINVYMVGWAPQWDNYHDRGRLAITLEAGGDFLRGLKIGVLKYDNWLDLGDFSQTLFDAGKGLLPDALKQPGLHDEYALQFSLAEEWRDCGFADAILKWRGNLDQFVDYVVQAFTQLKPLESILDQACNAIPILQDKDLTAFSGAALIRWDTSSALYVRNRLRLLSETMQQRCKDTCISVKYRYHYQFTSNQHPEWVTSDLLLMVKVGNFDIAIAFDFSAHGLNIQVISVYLPDFESGIATAFLKAKHPGLSFEGIPRKPTICDGLSVSEWMDRIQQCIESRVDAFIPALDDFAKHLDQCKTLTEFAADKLRATLPVEAGWVVENDADKGAASLEAGNPISIYRKSWLPESNGAHALPSIRIELVPNRPCFDDLYLSVKLLAQPSSELDPAFGQVFGACEFAFGPHEQVGNSGRTQVEWAKRLDPSIGLTGGSDFAKDILDDEGKAALASHLHYVAASILKMDPMVAQMCKKHMAEASGGYP
jgi:hypothetical protein